MIGRCLVLLTVMITATSVAQTPTDSYRIVHTYPHDPTAFTEGLFFHNGYLFESTGLEGRSTLRKVDLKSGKVVQQHKLPAKLFGEGIALLQGQLFQLTYLTEKALVYDPVNFRLQGDRAYSGEGWGLTHDKELLVESDGSGQLKFLEPMGFRVVRRLQVHDRGQPVSRLNELEYIDGEIYANVWETDRIARIDPATGDVHRWIDLTGLLTDEDRSGGSDVLNGIAYDPGQKRLFVTGKFWPKLFEVRIVPSSQ